MGFRPANTNQLLVATIQPNDNRKCRVKGQPGSSYNKRLIYKFEENLKKRLEKKNGRKVILSIVDYIG